MAQSTELTCIFCGQKTPPNELTEEHVIPRCLGNRNYTVKGVCTHCNGLMANAFENPLTGQNTLFRILHDAVRYQDPVSLCDGQVFKVNGELKRFTTRGEELIATPVKPKVHSRIDQLPIKLRDQNGAEHTVLLPLRKSFAKEIQGGLSEARKRAGRQTSQAKEYWEQLRDSAPTDDDLTAPERDFLRQLGELGIDPGGQELNSPYFDFRSYPDEVKSTESLKRKPLFYAGHYLRFFGKIAWLHTYQEFGPRAVQNPIADEIKTYILDAQVDASTRAVINQLNCTSETLHDWIRKPKANSREENLWLWKKDPDELIEEVSTCALPVNVVDAIRNEAFRRRNKTLEMATRITCTPPRVGIEQMCANPEAARHSIRFSTRGDDQNPRTKPPHTVCHIELFGGNISENVIIADHALNVDDTEPKVINFEHELPI